jgi:hypothetical protein
MQIGFIIMPLAPAPLSHFLIFHHQYHSMAAMQVVQVKQVSLNVRTLK